MTYPWQPVFPNVAPKDAGGYPQMDGFNHRGGFGVPNFDQTQEKHPELGRSHENQAAHVEYENLIKRILTILSLGYDGYDNS